MLRTDFFRLQFEVVSFTHLKDLYTQRREQPFDRLYSQVMSHAGSAKLLFSFLILEALAEATVESTSRAAHATLTRTTAHHGLSPRTIHSRFALGGLGPHGSARGGLRQRHLVVGAVVGGGGGGDHGPH